MLKQLIRGEVSSNREVAEGHYLMALRTDGPFPPAVPGQFLMLRAAGRPSPFLGRPLGVYSQSLTGKRNRVEVLYQVVGKGTLAFSGLKKKDRVEILGPLGRGFDLPRGDGPVVLVAGGIGIAPLTPLVRRLRAEGTPGRRMVLYFGARRSDLLIGVDHLRTLCTEVNVITDDGSSGRRGPVTDLVARDLKACSQKGAFMYACGPHGMLKSLRGLLAGHPIPCQVSVEERMACGVGACLGCVVEARAGQRGKLYKRVCMEGPVFDIREMVWE